MDKVYNYLQSLNLAIAKRASYAIEKARIMIVILQGYVKIHLKISQWLTYGSEMQS